jgi:hypothetical protein
LTVPISATLERSSPTSTPEFFQAMNHITNFLRVAGNPLAGCHFGNETYYNSVLHRVPIIENDITIFLTAMAQEARDYQERQNESKTHSN